MVKGKHDQTVEIASHDQFESAEDLSPLRSWMQDNEDRPENPDYPEPVDVELMQLRRWLPRLGTTWDVIEVTFGQRGKLKDATAKASERIEIVSDGSVGYSDEKVTGTFVVHFVRNGDKTRHHHESVEFEDLPAEAGSIYNSELRAATTAFQWLEKQEELDEDLAVYFGSDNPGVKKQVRSGAGDDQELIETSGPWREAGRLHVFHQHRI